MSGGPALGDGGDKYYLPVSILPCQTIDIWVVESGNPDGHNTRFVLLGADGVELYNTLNACFGTCTYEVPKTGTDWNPPLRGTIGPGGLVTSGYFQAYWSPVVPITATITITKRPRPGYNVGGYSFETARTISGFPTTVLASLSGRDPNQFFKFALSGGQRLDMSGTALASSRVGSNLIIKIYDSNGTFVAQPMYAAVYGPTALSASFTNPVSTIATYYIEFAVRAYGNYIQDLQLTLQTSPASSPPSTSMFFIALDGTRADMLSVMGGLPNTTLTYTLRQTNDSVLGLSTSSTGPWTDTLTMTITTDASGNGTSVPFYVLGETVGDSQVNACRSLSDCANALDYSVVTIARVEFVTLDSATDPNPNAGGGLRIFPDKQSVGDTIDRRQIRVRATLTAPAPGIVVSFRSFDLDDPSTDSMPVDTTGPAGDDNRGAPLNGYLKPAAGGSSTSDILAVSSSSIGIAEADLQVTSHPGDNFGVGVGVANAVVSALTVNGISLQDASGTALPTIRARATPTVTVWRRLHIETDTMGTVPYNGSGGGVTSTTYNSSTNQTTLAVSGPTLEAGRFENGRAILYPGGSFPVVTNSTNTVVVQGMVTGSPSQFQVYDDDDFNSNDGATKDGDNQEDITAFSDTYSLLQWSDDPTANVFAPAYIRPEMDGGGSLSNNNDSVPFQLNVSDSTKPAATVIAQARDSRGNGNDDFWVSYLLAAYQGPAINDRDPSTEETYAGITPSGGSATDASSEATVPIGGVGSLIYMEPLREVGGDYLKITAPHEVGHQFGITDENIAKTPSRHGIMRGDGTTFNDYNLNMLRWRVKSPGL